MEYKNYNKYSFLSQVLMLFAGDVIFLLISAYLVGDEAKEISTLYQFGSRGLAISTLLQFLLSSVVIIFFKILFFSNRFFKKMMVLWRTIFLLFSDLVIVIIFILVFHWFPINEPRAWIGFFLCFGSCFVISSAFMIIRTRIEDKKYQKLLSIYKNEREGDKENE